MYCNNCGNKLNQGEIFCSNCGTRIQSEVINNQGILMNVHTYNMYYCFRR